MSQVAASYRNTDKTPPKVKNIWPEMKRRMEAERIATQEARERAQRQATLQESISADVGLHTSRPDFYVLAEERRKIAALEREAVRKLKNAERLFADAKAEMGRAQVVKARTLSYNQIERRVCDLFGVTRTQLQGNSRDTPLVRARWMISYWACRMSKLSTIQIGKRLGRDHSTVIHGCRQWPIVRMALHGRKLRAIK